MDTIQETLADRLAGALLSHHASGAGPRSYDKVARAIIAQAEADLDGVVEAAVRLNRLVQETWEEDTRGACKLRKLYHRAWLRGLVAGAVERGISAPVVAEGIALATVPVAYEEAIALPVYAYSIGYGFGQAWAAISRKEPERQEWLAALKRGVGEGEARLRAAAAYHHQELDLELAPEDDKAVDNVESGFHLGSFTGFFTK